VFRVPTRTAMLVAACVLLPALTAASCGDKPSGVSLGTARLGTVDEIVEAPGSVTAQAAATVSATADGTLGDLRVEAGQRVTKGQVIAVIDSPAAEKRLEDAERALDAASVRTSADFITVRRRTDTRATKAFDAARAAAAKITDPTLRTALLTQVDVAEQQYAAAAAAADAAVRSVQQGVAGISRAVDSLSAAQRLQAQQAYDLAEAAVDALTLRAPVAGVVQPGGTAPAGTPSLTDLLSAGSGSGATAAPGVSGGGAALPGVDAAVPEGAAVSAGTPIVTIVDTGRLGLAAEVDETDVLLVKAGGAATVELDAAVGASYPATVRAVDLLPTTSARGGVSYRVRLDLGKGRYDDGRAAPVPRPGMSAVVRLRVRQATDAVTVPASAVVSADGRDTVWVVRGGKARRAPVTLGVQGEDTVQVSSGLSEGQQIVVAGVDQVSSGQDVP
jgi:HlyD family secretion protein